MALAVTGVMLVSPASAQDTGTRTTAPDRGSGDTRDGSSPSTTSGVPDAPAIPARPGRIAYVTLAGEVVVASSDGSSPKVLGLGAVTNKQGLAPLAWSADDTQIAYVRNDRKLIIVKISDGSVIEVDDNVVVPPDAQENILSFDITGKLLSYVSEISPGRYAAKSADFSAAEPQYHLLTDPANRAIQSLEFSPLDPLLLAQTFDPETRREFSVALLEPILGTLVAGPLSLEDPTFSPDGASAYGVVRNIGGVDQLVRIDFTVLALTPITEHERVCNPAVNKDATKVVFAAGPECRQVWVIDGDGQNERMLGDDFDGNSFLGGRFSWSLDDAVVSHAACKGLANSVLCGGAYWDIRVDGKGPRQRALAGSVRRETRPFLRPVKVDVEMTGPIEYAKRIILSTGDSEADLLTQPKAQVVTAKGVDEADRGRSFSLQAYRPNDTAFLTGTIRIVDGRDFDQTVMFMGRAQIASYRYAKIHAVWLDTSAVPVRSGRIDLVIYR